MALFPVFQGGKAPGYMGHISFVDAGAEVLLGVVLLLALGRAAVDEMAEANERLEAAQRWLRELVDADPLTGLHNRRGLRRFLSEAGDATGVLIYLDVDHFKSINDRWGHVAGDACLRRVGDGLREVFRNEDGKFRMGGDEFLVVAPGLAPEEARERIERLRRMLARSVEGQPAIGVSAGIAPFTPGTPMDEVLASADHAMYEDKGARRS
ncbi:MAG TPA: GGDEF domain-containing protein [Acidobacteria bacterium]|nr:GGDEF domain-containing protein [Acidobacteriota bacterium]